VTDGKNRKLVYELLNKASEASWDLANELDSSLDPFKSVEKDMKRLNHGIAALVASKHPLLEVLAKYYFQIPGKRFRPTVVLLMGRATQKDKEAENAAPRHVQLAEIVEMIHTASLAHDDVLDEAEERRAQPSINKFGNKFAVLVGDFLLARASVSLANLRDHTVTGLLSNMIAELVEGEFVQMRPQGDLSMEM
jgi:geranylgeranyl pyrophosphate synthase